MATKPTNRPQENFSKPETGQEIIEKPDININTSEILDEGIETGEVSEVLSENREKKSDSTKGQKTQTTKTDPAAIKARLLEKAPTPQKMAEQIEKEIKREINHLHGRILKMVILPGKIDYYEMNNTIKKIRRLREILKSLLKISLESLKTLWLRFVHGVI